MRQLIDNVTLELTDDDIMVMINVFVNDFVNDFANNFVNNFVNKPPKPLIKMSSILSKIMKLSIKMRI